jgi:peptidoglycan-associated lipoprotein
MNIFSKKLIIAIAGALLLFATGCVKKPSRPTPDLTMLNPGGGGQPEIMPVDISNEPPPSYTVIEGSTFTPPPILEQRPAGNLDGNELRNSPELQPVYFGFDRSAIEQKERAKFQAIKDYLAKYPQYRILFEGHCDWRGTAEYNMALGDRRANSAKRYAVSIGIDPKKIEVRSKGSTEATERGSDNVMAKDRRAEIVVLVK